MMQSDAAREHDLKSRRCTTILHLPCWTSPSCQRGHADLGALTYAEGTLRQAGRSGLRNARETFSDIGGQIRQLSGISATGQSE